MKNAFFAVGVLLLAGCAAPVDEETQRAEQEARKVVAATYPSVNANAVANCVVDVATEDEITALSLGALLAEEATLALMTKPEAATCLKRNGVVIAS